MLILVYKGKQTNIFVGAKKNQFDKHELVNLWLTKKWEISLDKSAFMQGQEAAFYLITIIILIRDKPRW